MKKIIKNVCATLLGMASFSLSYAVTVELPNETATKGTKMAYVETTEAPQKKYYLELANKINTILWSVVGIVTFIVLLQAGFLLLQAQGDEAKMKKANNMLLFGFAGIMISVFSYMIVRLVITLL